MAKQLYKFTRAAMYRGELHPLGTVVAVDDEDMTVDPPYGVAVKLSDANDAARYLREQGLDSLADAVETTSLEQAAASARAHRAEALAAHAHEQRVTREQVPAQPAVEQQPAAPVSLLGGAGFGQ